MPTLKFGFISFRSAEHLLWLLLSILIMVVAVSVVTLTPPHTLPVKIFQCFSTAYVLVALVAWSETSDGVEENGVFSPDCIWFNAAMGALYFILDMTIT